MSASATMPREATKERAAAMLAEGKTKKAVAAELGVSAATMTNWFPSDRIRGDSVARAQCEALRDEGLNYTQIAERVGISRQRVAQILGPLPYRRKHTKDVRLTISEETVDACKRIAKRLGAVSYQGPTTGEGNLSVLLDRIARGDFEVRLAEKRPRRSKSPATE